MCVSLGGLGLILVGIDLRFEFNFKFKFKFKFKFNFYFNFNLISTLIELISSLIFNFNSRVDIKANVTYYARH